MFTIRIINSNVLNLNLSIHRRLCNISTHIIDNMSYRRNDSSYFKLKNYLSLCINNRISAMTKNKIDYILCCYGIDNAISNYNKNYKIINSNITAKMLIINLLYNNYFEIVDLNVKKAVDVLSNFILRNKFRTIYRKKINIINEGNYLIQKINNEISCDTVKHILNKIVEKFISKTMKVINKQGI